MNHLSHNQHPMMIGSAVVLNAVHRLRQASCIPQIDMGDELYEWLDNQLEKFSSVRLAEMLHHKEKEGLANSCLTNAAKQELIRRGHYELSRGWKFIHGN